MPLLEVENLHAGYGPIEVLKGISLRVEPGEIVALIGANGAGKTSTLMAISGCLPARGGSIRLNGNAIHNTPPEGIVRKGLCHAPEGRKIFPRLTVLENLRLGAYTRNDKEGIAKDLEHALSLFPILGERKHQLGGTLSGGEQQMLAIARALLGRPKLLLLDEPSLGLAPLIVLKIFEVLRKLQSEGMAILLVEQAANLALKLANRGYVLETGNVTLSDTAANLLADKRVQEAYLGE
jgi:branched-chain amino acid transport system ATP-binding protein